MLTRCCRNSLKLAFRMCRWRRGPPRWPRSSPVSNSASERLHIDLAVADFDQIDVGLALAALLAFGTGLAENDIAVQALQLDIPQGGPDCRRFGLAGLLDRRRYGA